MTFLDMDDSIFADRNAEEMGVIHEEQFEDEKHLPKKRLSSGHSSSSNGNSNSNSNSCKFQYPATLDEEQTLTEAGRVARENGSVRHHKKPKKKVQKNRDFKDVEETGKWGAVSRKEILCVGTTLTLVVVGVLVGLFFKLSERDNQSEQIIVGGPQTIQLEKSYLSKQEHYDDLVLKINEYPIVADVLLQSFPEIVDDLAGETVYAEAALWMMYTDSIPVKWERNIIPRFVMAVTYIANGGDNWVNLDNWMWEQEVCDWFGVTCDGHGHITEIDLTSNGLTGTIHEAWHLFSNCTSIMLGNNALTGPIPGKALGNMAKLEYLYLDSNQLSGTIPVSLKDMDTLGAYLFLCQSVP